MMTNEKRENYNKFNLHNNYHYIIYKNKFLYIYFSISNKMIGQWK